VLVTQISALLCKLFDFVVVLTAIVASIIENCMPPLSYFRWPTVTLMYSTHYKFFIKK